MGSKKSVAKSDQLYTSRSLMECSENSKNKDKVMDFESGINKWVIDKKESNRSFHALNNPESNFTSIHTNTTMDKENVTSVTSSTEKNSLRCFRIRKDVSYKELSSESENESKKTIFSENDSLSMEKKRQPKVSCFKKRLSNVSYKNSSLTSLNDLNCITKEKESLSSDEMTLYLSELSSSSESVGKTREHLHSIENVASISETKITNENVSPTSLRSNCNILCSSSQLNCADEFNPYAYVSDRISLMSDNNQYFQRQSQKNGSSSLNVGSHINKSEFLDTYKTQLSNPLINSENEKKPYSGFYRDSERQDKNPDTYSMCNQELFKCNVCSYCCSDLLLHKSHLILFHSEKNILKCEYCDYQTSQCANLATHIRIHFQLECPYCDFQCPVKKSLESHLSTSHRRKTQYECNKCDFICKSKIKFTKHSQSHVALNKYKCSDCDLGFTNKKILKTHVRKHLTKEKTFKCVSCHLSFNKKQQLKIHLRSHDKKSYACDICSFKCTYKHKLEIHMRVHTRKSLKCGKCCSLFSRKNNLNLHMRDHFPNSKCQHCPFQSSDFNELSKHICIQNLYNVQKHTLNFENQNNVRSKIEQINVEKNQMKSRLVSTVVKSAIRVEEPTEESNNRHVPTKSAPLSKKRKPNRGRLLSLRSRLCSKMNNKSRNDKTETNLVTKLRHVDKSFKTLRKKNQVSDKSKHAYNPRYTLKLSSVGVDQVRFGSAKDSMVNIEFRQWVKQDPLKLLGLFRTKTFFNNKLTPKKILIEPVRFTNGRGSYIQCYYQSQPPLNSPSHLERHIRQSTLLSCRFCNYKTNSSRLLERHTAKNHNWDPAVVSMLFS